MTREIGKEDNTYEEGESNEMSENPLPPFKHVTKVLEVQRNKVYEKN
jgi:hypothetical protein